MTGCRVDHHGSITEHIVDSGELSDRLVLDVPVTRREVWSGHIRTSRVLEFPLGNQKLGTLELADVTAVIDVQVRKADQELIRPFDCPVR